VAGKWQLPLLAVSLILLAGAVYRLRPTPTRFSPEEAVDYLEALVGAGMYSKALDDGARILAREQPTPAKHAPVHRVIARALFEKTQEDGAPNVAVGREIVEHYEQAASHGIALTANDRRILGHAWEWQGRYAEAVEHYTAAIARGVDDAQNLQWHAITLRIHHSDIPVNQLANEVDRFLDESADKQLDLRLAAIEQRIRLAERLGTLDQAATLLADNHDRFRDSDLQDEFSYTEANLLFLLGHFDQAEVQLRTIRNRLEPGAELFARTGWLLGQVVLRDDGPKRPQEALSFFADVLKHHSSGPYAVASRVGQAEALAMLERHDEAIEGFQVAIGQLGGMGDSEVVSREVFRTSLGVLAESRRQEREFEQAVRYSRLAVALVNPASVEQATPFLEQLGQLQSLLAEHLEGGVAASAAHAGRPIEAETVRSRSAFAEAGQTYLELARLNALNERRASDASWRAAELFARAGRRERAANLYQAFVKERTEDPLVPRALLRVGQLKQVSGRLEEAVAAYRTCYRRFPRTLDGARALVPLAQCYLGMGPDHEELAEKTLRVVLEGSEVFTPQAPEFAEALFLLGTVLNTRGEFEQAIGALNEALERYPDGPRVWPARFLLADSYRQSGLAQKAAATEAKIASEIEVLRLESTGRFRKARQLYRQMISAYELREPESLDRLERTYLRHAYLYEADCFFEMRDYRKALELYEEAAARYRDTTSALAAYVQIINGYVFLGEPEEARASLARALVLVESMPDAAFKGVVSVEGRQDWKRYLEWLQQVGLF
jgi:tetratricopeptide (TPR) repeat protein